MKKRNLFDELAQGFDDLEAEREGKITLKTTKVKPLPEPKITPEEIIAIRKSFGYSQPIFANMMRVKTASLKNWEQGKSEPNPQARILFRLIEEEPDMLKKLAAV